MSEIIKPTKIIEGKLFYELDFEFITMLAQRMELGKQNGKYEKYKWKEGIDVEQLNQAILRHLLEVLKGNLEDEGQKYGHYMAIVANIMMSIHELKKNRK